MQVKNILHRVKEALADVPGIVGVVLGGSRARGTHHANSDIDIGIYYDPADPFDVQEVNKIARELDDEHRDNLITSLGEWGEWVNGGGWLMIDGYHVDFIFRDIHRVEKVMDHCLTGQVSIHYHTGHPHGYLNVMYMGELAICEILTDPENKLARLKAKTNPYPKVLQNALVNYFSFEASFSLMFAKDNVDKNDLSYVVGHCYRVIACLNQVIFALNETYCINEKKAVRMIENFPIRPKDYQQRIDKLITLISTDIEQTKRAVNILAELVQEVAELTDKYRMTS